MGSNQFSHLHVHTKYSIGDAMCKINDLVKKAKEFGMTAIASTDHGNMFSLVEFYLAAKKAGIKPILGCEAYICPEGQSFRPGKAADEDGASDNDRHNRHLVLLAKNMTGYQNLMKIISDASLNGFYYSPRTDFSILRKYSEGLIALTACLAGDVPRDIMAHGLEAAKSKLDVYIDIFGRDNVYIELQDNKIPEQYELNKLLIQLSEETGIPMVATNDVHYIEPEGARYHDALMAIGAKTAISSKHRKVYGTNDLYLKSPKEMWDSCLPESAIENTNVIAERCNVELQTGKFLLPDFKPPFGFKDSEEFLRHLAYKGLPQRFADYHEREEFYKNRLEYELGIVSRMGYVNYFLIVWDYVSFAATLGAIPSPGRGSGAGSLLSYSLYITHVDPIRYNLIFERFLNPDRFSPPDIDWDIQDDLRQQLIEYMVRRYGRDHISQIITFGTYAARNAVRASARALGLAYRVGDEVSKAIPKELKMTIAKALDLSPDLRRWYDTDPERKELLDVAMAIEGLPSNASTHAAGILITPGPTTDYVPVWKTKDGIVAQYDMNTLETLGLLKADLLGLKTLTVVSNTIKNIALNYGVHISNDDLMKMVDDPDSYKLIAQGRTQGIFQLEGAGMTATAKEMQPQNVEEVTALISLYRPGPMDYIPQYIAGKRDPEHIKLRFEALREILKETYGVIVYQEQVMFAVQILAGYPMSAADEIRKGTGKKIQKIIDDHRQYFIHGREASGKYVAIPGALSLGYDERSLNEFYNDIEKFGEYSFNKSHAASYAYVAAWTSWLKLHYPSEFMAALLTMNSGKADKMPIYIAHCENDLGIELLPPSINEGGLEFLPLKSGKIRFSLVAAKGVGINPVRQIMEERKRAPFRNFTDFVYRCTGKDISSDVVEGLIRCGAFDEFGVKRSQLLSMMYDILGGAKKLYEKTTFKAIQTRLFEPVIEATDVLPDILELPKKALLKAERGSMGVYVTGHPLDVVKAYIRKVSNISSTEFAEELGDDGVPTGTFGAAPGRKVKVVGILNSIRETSTKKNKELMGFANLEDELGNIPLVIFPREYAKFKQYLVDDAIVCVSGFVGYRDDDPPNIIVEKLEYMEDRFSKRIYIKLKNVEEDTKLIMSIVRTAGCHGDIPVFICIDNTQMLISEQFWVNVQGMQSLEYSDLIISVKEE